MTAHPLPYQSRPTPPPVEAMPLIASDMPIARFGLVVNCIVPLVLLIWDALHHALGASATVFALHTTGFIALIFLLLSLLVTPLRSVTGFSWLVQFRRALGLYAFFYTVVHLTIYYWWYMARDLRGTVYEISHRSYLIIGMTSLLLMAPLAATSFNAAIRFMGGKNWKLLHRLAYPAAVLGCIHFYMQAKSDKQIPWIFAGILTAELAYRGGALAFHRKAGPATVVGATRFWKGNLRVDRMSRETDSVRTFRLVAEAGGLIPFSFSAGQFLTLSPKIDGKKVNRSYTIASPPTRKGYVELTIKREDNGQVSKYLHDMLMTGQSVAVSAPAGRFTFDESKADSVLLIAGGVGITPVMSILRNLTDRNWAGRIDLVFSVKSASDVIFASELQSLVAAHPNFHAHVTVTRDAPADWPGERGRVTMQLLEKCVPDFRSRPAFVCGPNEMADAVRTELVQSGVDAKRVTVESFTPAAAVKTDAGGAAVTASTITFAQSGQTAPLPSDKSVLEVAESAGVSIDYDCRSGICGQCRCKLISGQVTMAVQDALSDADIADGYILACQAHATEDVTIDA